jgi:hypothetical protein
MGQFTTRSLITTLAFVAVLAGTAGMSHLAILGCGGGAATSTDGSTTGGSDLVSGTEDLSITATVQTTTFSSSLSAKGMSSKGTRAGTACTKFACFEITTGAIVTANKSCNSDGTITAGGDASRTQGKGVRNKTELAAGRRIELLCGAKTADGLDRWGIIFGTISATGLTVTSDEPIDDLSTYATATVLREFDVDLSKMDLDDPASVKTELGTKITADAFDAYDCPCAFKLIVKQMANANTDNTDQGGAAARSFEMCSGGCSNAESLPEGKTEMECVEKCMRAPDDMSKFATAAQTAGVSSTITADVVTNKDAYLQTNTKMRTVANDSYAKNADMRDVGAPSANLSKEASTEAKGCANVLNDDDYAAQTGKSWNGADDLTELDMMFGTAVCAEIFQGTFDKLVLTTTSASTSAKLVTVSTTLDPIDVKDIVKGAIGGSASGCAALNDDSSGVNATKIGSITALYSAGDTSGMTAAQKETFLQGMGDRVFENQVTPGQEQLIAGIVQTVCAQADDCTAAKIDTGYTENVDTVTDDNISCVDAKIAAGQTFAAAATACGVTFEAPTGTNNTDTNTTTCVSTRYTDLAGTYTCSNAACCGSATITISAQDTDCRQSANGSGLKTGLMFETDTNIVGNGNCALSQVTNNVPTALSATNDGCSLAGVTGGTAIHLTSKCLVSGNDTTGEFSLTPSGS